MCLLFGLASAEPVLPERPAFGHIPLSFEANQGQAGASTQFLARGRGYSLSLNRDGVVLALARHRGPRPTAEPEAVRPVERTLLRMTLEGANPAPSAAGLEELPGKVNYFIGKDPKTWRTNIPTYGKVRYGAVYRGIDLVYYGNGRQLEYDFIVAPGADPSVITLAFGGADALTVSSEGDLVLQTRGGELRLRKPLIYQEVGGAKRGVPGGYVVKGERAVGFQVAAYDQTIPLIIDPVLVYSTYLGGLGEDNGSGIAADATGIYLAGLTASPDFPTGAAPSPYQGTKGADYDAFVTKLNPAGTALIYSTYLGGNGTDYGLALAIDGDGNAYVTGLTASTDFPMTASAYQSTNSGGTADAFLTKLNASGTDLLYSTYLGGTGDDRALGVAVDVSGNAYVTGQTSSTNFPVGGTPLQGASGGGPDAFVAKLNPTASGPASLVYATYLGGSANDAGIGIVVDAAGNATVVGRTGSTDFPMGPGPFQSTNGGGFDVFVAKLDPGGTTLLYATYLGGSGDDWGYGIARDSVSNVYITGNTTSPNFPTTAGAFDTGCGSDDNCNFVFLDAFVAKLDPTAAGADSLVYSTYLGGSRDDEGRGIGVDGSGRAHVAGWTDSTDFPIANAFQPLCGMGCGSGFVDAFVTTLNAAGSAIEFSTYLGGSSSDYGIGLFVDAAGNTYVTGDTYSDNFPTVNPLDGTWGNFAYDAFVVKIDNATTSADLAIGKTASPDPATAGLPLTYTLTVTNNGPNPASGVRLIDRMPAWNLSVTSATPSQGTCTVANDGFSAEVRCDLGSLAASASATATIVVTPGTSGTITNSATVASSVSDPNGANNAATRDTVVVLPPPPTITSISPASGAVGINVTINGTNLAGATSVTFNGTSATYSMNTGTRIIAVVPADATTGPIHVTTAGGTATSAATFTVAPRITELTPSSGAPGTSVTIAGANFAGVTSVRFNGVNAAFSVVSSTEIMATVPANATTGAIAVATTPGGTATSATSFVVAPRITSFTPSSGASGASVTINGANLAGASSVTFNSTPATITLNTPIKITATVPAGASTGRIAVTTDAGTATSATNFTVNLTPTISGFSPSSGGVGVPVTITGTNFSGATSVKLNGLAAPFAVNLSTKITMTVPGNATTGLIAVTTPGGTATSATSFTVAPRITSFTPANGVIGTSVTINGANFTGASAVTFNGTAATFTVNTPIKITATVPSGATTGKIAVTTPAGPATSVGTFAVKPAIASFAPGSGAVGAEVTITGAALTGATSVKFNGFAAAFTVDSSTKIRVTVPANATSGSLSVTTPGGTATSATSFTVAPRITSFTPPHGVVGATVAINGANFTGASSVTFNGTLALGYVVNSAVKITATVPAGATTGKIRVTTTAGTATSTGNFTIP